MSSWRPGARARDLPGIEADGKLVWTYKEAMVPGSMPTLAAGCRLGRHRHRVREFLSRTMGAEVTVVEVLPEILPAEDAEISALARKAFVKQGMKILYRRHR